MKVGHQDVDATKRVPGSDEDIRLAGKRSEPPVRLDRALDELPEKFRLVLMLSAIEGHTLDEISRLLDVPTGTVKSRLFFARRKLAERMK